MDLLQKARDALELIQKGREALADVASAVNDGKAALDSDEQQELTNMLQRERRETAAAHQSLQDAINRRLGVVQTPTHGV